MSGLLSFIKTVLQWAIIAIIVFGANLSANYFLYEAESQTTQYVYCFSYPNGMIGCKVMSELHADNQKMPKPFKKPKPKKEPIET